MMVWVPAPKLSDGWCQAGKWRLTLILQSCISIMTSQPKADQNLREVGEGCCVTNHRNNKQEAVKAAGERQVWHLCALV